MTSCCDCDDDDDGCCCGGDVGSMDNRTANISAMVVTEMSVVPISTRTTLSDDDDEVMVLVVVLQDM